jgi:Tfp pilus assembly protein PilN
VQLVVIGLILVVVVAVLVAVDSWQRGQIRAQTRANRVIENRIERIRRQIQDHDQIRERIEEIEAKQAVIDRLQSGRTGPVMIMVELAKLVSRNGSPTIDHDRYMDLVRRSPGLAYDPNWDGRRLWLREFREENREAELNGEALSHEDVAELLRRMNLSDFFHRVVLVKTESHEPSDSESYLPTLVSFEVRCNLRYSGRAEPEEEPEEPNGARTKSGGPSKTKAGGRSKTKSARPSSKSAGAK